MWEPRASQERTGDTGVATGCDGHWMPHPDAFIVKFPLYQILGVLAALQELPGLQRTMSPEVPALLDWLTPRDLSTGG